MPDHKKTKRASQENKSHHDKLVLKNLTSQFIHDAAKLDKATFQAKILEGLQSQQQQSFPLLELTRQFVLEDAWKDLFKLLVEISSYINEAVISFKGINDGQNYPLSDDLDFAFQQDKLFFIPHVDVEENVITAIDWPSLYCDFNKGNKCSIYLDNASLMSAISCTQSKDALSLIMANADINKYTLSYGNNPILLAVAKGWNHVDSEPDEQDMNANQNQKEIIEALLMCKNLDVNAVHLVTGMNVIHILCIRGDEPSLVEWFIQKGADFAMQDCKGKTPLDYLKLSYAEAKNEISQLTGNYKFGNYDLQPHQSATTTLPTEQERARNILIIEKIIKGHMIEPEPEPKRLKR